MRKLAVFLPVGLLAIAGIWYLAKTEGTSPPPVMVETRPRYSEGSPEGAFESCLDRVRSSAKASSEASFPTQDEVEITKIEDGRYRVSGMATWRNEAGAPLRVEFVCTMGFSERGRWIAENLALSER